MRDAIMHRVWYRPQIDDGDRIELMDDELILHSETDERGALELWTALPIEDAPKRTKSNDQLAEELETWKDNQDIRPDGGTEGIDESQTVREAAQPVVTMLRACGRSDHCNRLAEVMSGPETAESINREDLLYPMRCHRDDGLVLRVEGKARVNWMQYGVGDLFYWLTEDDRTLSTAVETINLWEALQAGMIDVQPVMIEDTPHGDDR